MIELRSLAYGPFSEIEALNPQFSRGHPKLRITVDTETSPRVPETDLHGRLAEAFPGLTLHHCQIRDPRSGGEVASQGIVLLDGEPSANQAHLLEHLVLEMLGGLDHEKRLSGVTCAYHTPRERNDVFVECSEPSAGRFVLLLALDAMNEALGGGALVPLYPDAVRCVAAANLAGAARSWYAGDLAREADLPEDRAASVLGSLERLGIARRETYAMNFSGDPVLRVKPGGPPPVPARS